MKKSTLCFLIIFILLASTFSIALAADYSFRVPQQDVIVWINSDGTVTIDYTIDFQNDAGAAAIDYVDLGMPNNAKYSLANVKAEIDGANITDISDSQYVKPGIALGLGSKSIRASQSGNFHFRITKVQNMFYQSDVKAKEPFASMQFSPSWFDSNLAHGSTNYTLTIYLPPGVKPDEPIYYTPQGWPGSPDPITGTEASSELSFYKWKSNSANSYSQYIFGTSFPGRLIPAAAIQTKPLIQLSTDDLICIGCVGFFGLITIWVIYAATIGAKKRKLQYLPPKISIEGNGIKRGLTAVEASILMETPMDKVMTMILFSVVKKDAASVVTKEPLEVKPSDPLPDGLNQYEIDFLNAFKQVSGADRRKALQDMMVDLVKSVTEKMRGFSRKETIAYYKDIMTKAWEQVEAADTPEVKMQKYDEVMGWTMLDNNYDQRTRNVFGQGPVIVPMWWGRYNPGYHPSLSGTSGPSISIPRPNVPGSDFAASIVNGVQSMAGGILGDVTGFTSGITNKTNPPPPPSTSSSSFRGSSGGGHCACACACAGCACACAGGGR